ncbi:MAG: neutral zinc metallopeptidase [Pseudonocardia sp.]|uniref:neutral zinc metallopeptidase n=1 Tax=Pseudonocardia sp. TaxID=60912 RepID=UPI001ACC3FE4|nr:neutral zinc metallopeptidase [Pseudonocardia sp.]MBN9097420.1 neutral zinc metallopeptidase [Pseudonocardia sp.]
MRIPIRGLTAVVCVLLVLVTGCARFVPGRARAAPATGTAAIAAPPPVDLSDVTTALQGFWDQAFPAAFGQPWRDIRRFVPVHTASRSTATPPCVERAADLDGQAFYCPAADAVVWDADGLLPQIRREFGTAGVVVVLAHEVGHAVQTRLGVDEEQARDPAAFPTILLEAMSDCYAGATLASLSGRPGLDVGDRDTAVLALVGFRDPVGIGPSDASAHGNAFDRVSAFQDGWTGGPTLCAAMTVAGRAFTERRFGSAADQARGGNLPLAQLLPAVETDARQWFTALAAPRAPGWRAPALRTAPGASCSRPALTGQGPARFCAADGSIDVDRPALTTLEDRFGDYAAATLVASRYAMAALTAMGRPAEGPAAVCLAGAYTARLLDPSGSFTLSPGDLDEAVQVLLTADWAARSPQGTVDGSEDGFDRVTRFRQGVRQGAASCLR